MNTSDPKLRLLQALFALAQEGLPRDLFSVADEAGLNLYRTLKELAALSDAGLVCARRLTLTSSGLAVYVATHGLGQVLDGQILEDQVSDEAVASVDAEFHGVSSRAVA